MNLDRNGYGPMLIPWENGCFVCGRNGPLQRHEIFHGPYRAKSKRYGCWTTICQGCHDKVHRDALLDRKLKVIFQHRAMKTYGWHGKRRENAERARQNEADFVAKESREKALRQRRDAQKRRKRK